ncbi:hypothetical protein ACFLR0_02320 [Candidatus Bipolaricaulota bacterium]
MMLLCRTYEAGGAMAIHILDISVETLAIINKLISLGKYESVDQFLAISLRNQLVIENVSQQETRSNVREEREVPVEEPPRNVTAHSIKRRSEWSAVSVDLEQLPSQEGITEPLWGQYYRYLPLKLALRVIAAHAMSDPVDLEQATDLATTEAAILSGLLRHADDLRKPLGLLSLSVGFPNGRNPEKSRNRYASQYVGAFSRSGQLYGFASDIGFLVHPENSGETAIQLTSAGARFTAISNPILDNGDLNEPLSSEEVDYLLGRIAARMPGERIQLSGVLKSISEGASDPSELRECMAEIYRNELRQMWQKNPWSDNKVALMVSGATSRLIEMGHVERKRQGQHVSYVLTGNWEGALGTLAQPSSGGRAKTEEGE